MCENLAPQDEHTPGLISVSTNSLGTKLHRSCRESESPEGHGHTHWNDKTLLNLKPLHPLKFFPENLPAWQHNVNTHSNTFLSILCTVDHVEGYYAQRETTRRYLRQHLFINSISWSDNNQNNDLTNLWRLIATSRAMAPWQFRDVVAGEWYMVHGGTVHGSVWCS